MDSLNPQTRMRESASRLPDPVTIGSDYSTRPMPGQTALPLESAGYREAPAVPSLSQIIREHGHCGQ